MEKLYTNVEGIGWLCAVVDVVFPGVGWVAVSGCEEVKLRVFAPEWMYVGLRRPLLTNEQYRNRRRYVGIPHRVPNKLKASRKRALLEQRQPLPALGNANAQKPRESWWARLIAEEKVALLEAGSPEAMLDAGADVMGAPRLLPGWARQREQKEYRREHKRNKERRRAMHEARALRQLAEGAAAAENIVGVGQLLDGLERAEVG